MIFTGELLDRANLGLGYLVWIHPRYAHPVLMDMQHNPGRLGLRLMKNLLQNLDDELHRGVIVVKQDALVEPRLLGLGLLLGAALGDCATAQVVTTDSVAIATTRPKLPAEQRLHFLSTSVSALSLLHPIKIETRSHRHKILFDERWSRAKLKDIRGAMASIEHTSGEVEIAVVDSIRKIPCDEWNALLAPDDTPFLDWDWLSAMEESKSASRKTGWAPQHLVLRTGGDRRVVGACPLYLKSHSMGEFVFDHGWADAAERAGLRYFPKLLVGVPFTPHTGRRFLAAADVDRDMIIRAIGTALARLCEENKISSVHVNFCTDKEAAVLRELGYLERLGYQYHWINDGFASFDDYLGQLKSKRRYAIRHERGALDQQGVQIRALVGDEIPDAMFGTLYKIYLTTIQKLYWGRQYLTRDFFELLCSRFKRHLCFVGAWRGEELVGGTINLQKAGVFYGRYWGCFEELRYLHFNVCYYAAIEHCIASGIERFEPGAGGEYKWLRGFNPAPTRSMHFISHGGLRKAIANFLVRERQEVENWIAEGREHGQLKAPPPSNVEPE